MRIPRPSRQVLAGLGAIASAALVVTTLVLSAGTSAATEDLPPTTTLTTGPGGVTTTLPHGHSTTVTPPEFPTTCVPPGWTISPYPGQPPLPPCPSTTPLPPWTCVPSGVTLSLLPGQTPPPPCPTTTVPSLPWTCLPSGITLTLLPGQTPPPPCPPTTTPCGWNPGGTPEPTTCRPTSTPRTVPYRLTGSSVLAKLNATVPIGPADGTLTYADTWGGPFTGTFDLPPSTLGFRIFGFLPTTAEIRYDTGTTRGTLTGTTLTSTTDVTIKPARISFLGMPVFQSSTCATATKIDLAGTGFAHSAGGNLTGTYPIPDFTNCGTFTNTLNSLVAGPGNTLKINLILNNS